jgi:NADH dehydrogenase [ubiquinone] 1 alpha subcomplex assembly factor 7
LTTILEVLKEKIQNQGAISVAEYMDTCLYHEKFGYYMSREPLGQKGDFTTAPEISQIFGEMIGAWVADSWIKLGNF